MIDPAQHWATYVHGFNVTLMITLVVFAWWKRGGDVRLLIGGIVIFVTWIATLNIQRAYGDWNSTSYLFLGDGLVAFIFHQLSRGDKITSSKSRNWAGFVSISHICMILLHFMYLSFGDLKLPYLGEFATIFCFLISIIILRAYGFIWFLCFVAMVGAVLIGSVYFYGWLLNILFASAVITISLESLKVIKRFSLTASN